MKPDVKKIKELTRAFTDMGAKIILPAANIQKKLGGIKAFVFDWDGVFNNGYKSESAPSLFAEPDAAGLNLLRFSYFLKTNTIPLCAIITGEENPGAVRFAEREHLNAVYMQTIHKPDAVNHFCEMNKITPSQAVCVYDDMNDISMAKLCGLRFMVRKPSAPMLQTTAVRQKFCDYVTGNIHENYPVREICEFIMALNGDYEKSLLSRVAFDAKYQEFLQQKKSVKPLLYNLKGQRIKVKMPE